MRCNSASVSYQNANFNAPKRATKAVEKPHKNENITP